MGFFEPSPSKLLVVNDIPQCGVCALYKRCVTPKMPVWGYGRKGVLMVGEMPSVEADADGLPIVGSGLDLVQSVLEEFGYGLVSDCWYTNSIICNSAVQDEPTLSQVGYCRPNIMGLIQELEPRVIVLFGKSAVDAVLGPYWKEGGGLGSINRWAGWQIPMQEWNAWVVPMWHPDYVMNHVQNSKWFQDAPALKLWFKRYLRTALSAQGRPWDVVPDYVSRVQSMYDPQDAASWVRRKIASREGVSTFDYETNCLKPDSDKAAIVSASICWDGETIAFPWVGAAVGAMAEYTMSDCPKIGANAKFEDRWTLAKLGHRVSNWVWDVVLDAHILNNCPGITSVKFQALVRLGYPDWSVSIGSFLKGGSGNELNTIHLVELSKLLLYNGLDSLCQYEIALKQRAEYRGGFLF